MPSVRLQVRYDAASGTAVVWCRACGVLAVTCAGAVAPAMAAFLTRHSPDPCPRELSASRAG